MTIDAKGKSYRALNAELRDLVRQGVSEIEILNVLGHRYLGCGLSGSVQMHIRGVPGNDMAAFMNGPTLRVEGNAQEGVGNTMNAGKVIIFGDSGDILGHSMRGGKIYVKGSVGYRTGIHMKSYQDHFPVVVVGETAQDYLGEYMAGGVLVVLGLNQPADSSPVGSYVGTGMHNGHIVVRGRVSSQQLGKEVQPRPMQEADWALLAPILSDYASEMGLGSLSLSPEEFVVLSASTSRPYGNLYVY